MSDKSESYLAGCRDAKAKSMEEKIDDLYIAFFFGKDCFTVRVSNLETWMKVLGFVCSLVLAPIIVILVAKVFFRV